MEIIKHGDPKVIQRKKDPRRLFKCSDCGCIFKSDNFYQGRSSRNEPNIWTNCPECDGLSYEEPAS